MKLHYCIAEQCLISYEGECNWCGEKEEETDERPAIQITIAPVLEPAAVPQAGANFQLPVASV